MGEGGEKCSGRVRGKMNTTCTKPLSCMHTAVESFSIHSCHDGVFMLVSSLQDAVTCVTIITCKGIV